MESACAILAVARPALLYFSTPSHELHDFLNIQCVFRFSLQLLSATFLILRRTYRDMIINVRRASCKVAVILITF